MSDTRLRQRDETSKGPATEIPAPQWRGLFLAPDWGGTDEQVIVAEEARGSEYFTGARRPRGGRRSSRRAA
ncbi:hypothetical protein [Streptomyces geysiriensis]|uniref:hypothetical protein n=1 Tax=Streptomyces geysiriensis TaxID=68207 RepID=UPI001C7CAEA2|nr:hypothetical protein [Streptomyces geysiriensis]MBX4174062.1 hypothetical protein [Streptomyces geysiriensis]